MLKYGCYFLWKRKLYLVEKYFSELMWIFDVDIYYEDSCVKVNGFEKDVNDCLSSLEILIKKGGKNEL